MVMNLKRNQIIIYLGLFFVSAGLTYLFSALIIPALITNSPSSASKTPVATVTKAQAGILQYEGPKIAACPINGEMHTQAEQSIWSTRRPLVVMIENHADARPQSNKKALALEQIGQYGWANKGTWSDMNEFSLSYKVCRREPDRTGTEKATEHTMYCSTTALWDLAASRGLTNITQSTNASWDKNFRPWLAKSSDQSQGGGPATISFDFWTGYKDYTVAWKYNSTTNAYTRYNGGQPYRL